MSAPWRIRCLAAAILLAFVGSSLAALAEDVIDGRALYHGFIAFSAGKATTSSRLPAAYVACANCHGNLAEGGREGALMAPSIAWSALTKAADGQAKYESAEAILRAIEQGAGRGGRRLSSAMPRYRLSAAEGKALIDHLRRAGLREDVPPGISRDMIRLGTVLPLSGPAAAVGNEILSGLNDGFETINAGGGIHGRRIKLLTADAADASAVDRLFDMPVYALVGSLGVREIARFEGLLARHRIANLASLSIRPQAGDATAWDLDLLPPLDVQQTMLETALGRCDGERWAILLPGAPPPRKSATRWITAADRPIDFGPGGCLGLSLGAAGTILDGPPATWRMVVVSPLPVALLSSPGGPPWRQLGRAAAGLVVELISQAGPALTERSPLDVAHRLDGFEPIVAAPVRFNLGRHYAWDPQVFTTNQILRGRHTSPEPSR